MTERSSGAFWLQYSVQAEIPATPASVWTLLTDAAGFPRWNSTVTAIEGDIRGGERLAITVPVAPGRTFRPRVTTFEPFSVMVWSDGQAPFFSGRRTFTLSPTESGTRFAMVERFSGIAVPLARRSLPDFGPIFDQYVSDLRAAAG